MHLPEALACADWLSPDKQCSGEPGPHDHHPQSNRIITNPKMKADRILQSALAIMLAAFCFALYTQLHQNVVSVGDTAPDFSITTDSGKVVSARDFGGKVLLLNFWATWCPPCVEEIPSLNNLATQLGPKGLVILGVSVDQNEQLYKAFLQRSPLAYLTARDPAEKINLKYGTIQYPESYLIDRNGKVLEKFISNQVWDSPQMLQQINGLL
jgi:cytochrome c biogenesis protein CcmG, thiol:disulfide interchange protein DsbE